MKEPLVTICIPNYNNGKYLKECIESALNQDYKNTEIIISDNKSNDNSLEILDLYKRQKKVNIIKQKSFLSMTSHWNIFKKFINGELVMWLSSDDVLLENCISCAVKMYKKNNYINSIFIEYDIIDQYGNISNKIPFYKQSAIIDAKSQFEIFLKGNNFPLSTCIMTKKIFCEIRGFNEKYNFCSDWFMWLSITEKYNYKVGYIQQKLILYRVHSCTETNRNIINKNAICEIKKMKAYFIDKNYIGKEKIKWEENSNIGIAKISLIYAKLMKDNNLLELEDYYVKMSLKLNPKIINERLFKELQGKYYKSFDDNYIKDPYDLPKDSIMINF